MVLHSSLSAASAEAHRHDLLRAAEQYHTASVLWKVRRAMRHVVGRPDPPAADATQERNSGAKRRYAMSR